MKIHLYFKPPTGFRNNFPFSKQMPNGLIRCDCGGCPGWSEEFESYLNYKVEQLNKDRNIKEFGVFFIGDETGKIL